MEEAVDPGGLSQDQGKGGQEGLEEGGCDHSCREPMAVLSCLSVTHGPHTGCA